MRPHYLRSVCESLHPADETDWLALAMLGTAVCFIVWAAICTAHYFSALILGGA